MYDLCDEKTREWFTGLDKGQTEDFKTLKDFKKLQGTSTTETSNFRNTSKNFKRFRKASRDLKDVIRLQLTSSDFKRLHKT
jgi:hypothetical protein